MSDSKLSPKTNVIWLVPPEDWCAECGYAITKKKPVNNGGMIYTESDAVTSHKGTVHKDCFIKDKPRHGWMTADLMRKKADAKKEKA